MRKTNASHKIISLVEAVTSKQGSGPFLSEMEIEEQIEFFDTTGDMRYGWIDIVRLRYELRQMRIKEVCLFGIDRLSSFETIKICFAYSYNEDTPQDFCEMFRYYGGFIDDIKRNGASFKYFFERFQPVYKEMDGWQTDISKVIEKEELPENCIKFIGLVELFIGFPIKHIAVGTSVIEL